MKKVLDLLYEIKTRKLAIFPAFIVACSILITIHTLFGYKVSSFNRIISVATANDYNVSKFILNIFILITIFILSFFISYVFFSHLRGKHSKGLTLFWYTFDRFSVIASVAVTIILITTLFLEETTDKLSIFTPTFYILLICFATLILYPILNLKSKIKFGSYQKLIIVILVTTFAICVAIPKFLPYINLVQAFICILCIIVIKFLKIKTAILDSIISGFIIIFSIFPILLSIFIEGLNILNQHEIFISNPLLIYRILLIILGIIAIITSFIFHKKAPANFNWKKFVYPALIIGISMLSIQLPLVGTYSADIFESANYSVLISDFLNFSKIPIIEHYGGHMLTQFFGGIFYGLLNNDFAGAIYSPYSIYFNVIIYTIAYFFISKITDRDTAFFSIIAIPFISYNFIYFGLGFIIIFSLINYFKNTNFKSAFLVDLCILICTLYRLDLGVAFGISAIISSIIYAVVKKKSLKKIIVTSITFVIFTLSLWFIICGIKGLDGLAQIKQFIAMSASNQNWAYIVIKKASTFTFIWSYIVLPIIMAFSLLYIIFTKVKHKINAEIWLMLLALGIAYFANFSRSIVRHNIIELPGSTHVLFWTAYLYLAIFISTLKQNPIYFIPSYILLTIINFVLIGLPLTSIDFKTPIDNIPNHITFAITDHKVSRINIDSNLESELLKINTFIEPFLNPNETFFDFTNHNLIYSYMGKPDPIYATQTPGHLNGEFTQEAAISDLSKNSVKLILMPTEDDNHLSRSLDDIPNSLRYYRISEYIYQNFIPLLEFETGEIWIARNLYQDSLKNAEKLCEETSCQILSKNNKSSETYDIGYIPLSWGEKDIKNASSNEKITDAKLNSNGYYIFDNNFDKSTGNYVKLIINSDNTHNEEVTLGSLTNSGFKETAKYIFTVEPGEHTYLLRASHDEDWYNSDVNAIKTSANTNISILKGD